MGLGSRGLTYQGRIGTAVRIKDPDETFNIDDILDGEFLKREGDLITGGVPGAGPPAAHDLAGAEHNADTLADLNAKITDATLDDASSPRDPNAHNHAATDINSGVLADARVQESNVTQHEAAIDHNQLANYAIGEHRQINDGGASATELWSSSKINADIAALQAGASPKESVRLATKTDGNHALSGLANIDGVTPIAGDRIGVVANTNEVENGVYIAAAGAWTRAGDFDGTPSNEVRDGVYFNVSEGTNHQNHRFMVISSGAVVNVGVDTITFDEMISVEFGTSAGTAAEGNDSRIPTQDENDALQGAATGGPLTNANRAVADDDSRLDPATKSALGTMSAADKLQSDRLFVATVGLAGFDYSTMEDAISAWGALSDAEEAVIYLFDDTNFSADTNINFSKKKLTVIGHRRFTTDLPKITMNFQFGMTGSINESVKVRFEGVYLAAGASSMISSGGNGYSHQFEFHNCILDAAVSDLFRIQSGSNSETSIVCTQCEFRAIVGKAVFTVEIGNSDTKIVLIGCKERAGTPIGKLVKTGLSSQIISLTVIGSNIPTLTVDGTGVTHLRRDGGSVLPEGNITTTGPNIIKVAGDELRETAGPTLLAMGAVPDGGALKRSGSTIIGQQGIGNLNNFGNGAVIETVDVNVIEDATQVKLQLQQEGGGDLTVQIDGVNYIFDATPTPGEIVLTEGSDENPVMNYVYLIESGGAAILAVSTSGFPGTAHAPIAEVFVQTDTDVAANGAMKVHVWTDHMSGGGNGTGHLGHINKRLRGQHAEYIDGVDPTVTIKDLATDEIYFKVSSGNVFQLHEHVFPALDSDVAGDPIYVVNDFTTKFVKRTNLGLQLADSTGASLTGRFYSLVFWGAVNEDTGDCKLMCNAPDGSYGNQTGVEQDSDKFANYSIPKDFKGVGFLIAEAKFRNQGDSTFTQIGATIDLRDQTPGAFAGGGAAGAKEFPDGDFRIFNTVDDSKKVEVDVSAVSAATVRKITMPDRDILLDYKSVFLDADVLENPVNSDWIVNALAIAAIDSNNNGLNVRRFIAASEQGAGFKTRIPTGATTMTLRFMSRAETAPGAAATVGAKLYFREIPDNGAVSATWAGTNDGSKVLTDIDIPTNENFQQDEQTLTLATEGIVAGSLYQFELTRIDPTGGTELTSDWALLSLELEFA
jgi:hypothetical protein